MSSKNSKAKSERERVSSLLTEIVGQLRRLTDEEFDAVFSGQRRLKITIENGKKQSGSNKGRIEDGQLREIAENLKRLDSREAAHALIDQSIETKVDLSRLARILDVPTQKRDSGDHIAEKIVEATVGFRLRSAAVKGSGSVSR